MLYKTCVAILFVLLVNPSQAQQRDTVVIDSTFFDYEELFSELDALLDSLSTPRSMALINLGIGQNVLNYESKSNFSTTAKKRFVYSPSIGYLHRSGFGLVPPHRW